jgi:hypothetical protein
MAGKDNFPIGIWKAVKGEGIETSNEWPSGYQLRQYRECKALKAGEILSDEAGNKGTFAV